MSVNPSVSKPQNVVTALPGDLWKAVALCAAFAFAYATVLSKLGSDWWNDENYSHGLLVPVIIAYILWTQRQRLTRSPHTPATFWGLSFVSIALLGLWAGTAGAELFIQRISMVVMLGGVVIYLCGFRLLQLLFVPFILLLLAIPVPAIIFNKIAFPLQLFASRCAVASMGLLDIPVLRQGNVIELMPLGARETKRLEVVEACSGIRSLMTLVTLAVVFAYFTHPRQRSDNGNGGGLASRVRSRLSTYGFWRSTLLVLSAVPIAIFTNALRVSGTGVLAHYYGTQVADGFFHSFSGWMIYIVAFVMLFGVGLFLDRVRPTEAVKKNSRLRTSSAVLAVQTEGVE